jgi:hypothetical protein
MRATTLAAILVIVFIPVICKGQSEPFNYLKVSTDAGGFITLAEGDGPYERFFPLGTFFYPAILTCPHS